MNSAACSAPRVAVLGWIAELCAIFALVMGGSVLVGWAVRSEVLTAVVPGNVAMNPLTAVMFMIAGAGLLAARHGRQSPRRQVIACCAGLLAAAIGAVRLADYFLGWSVEVDRLLFGGSLQDNRMAPNTAMLAVFLGVATAASSRSTALARWILELCALIVAAASLCSLLGYAYAVRAFYTVGAYIPMSLNTAFTFAVFAAGLLCVQADRGLLRVVAADLAGGRMARRLLLVGIIVPVVIGWLLMHGERNGWYESDIRLAMSVTATVVIFLAATWWTAFSLNKSDDERRWAYDEMRKTAATGEALMRSVNQQLEQRVAERTAELATANADLRREVDERVRTEQSLRDSEARLSAILDTAVDGIITIDERGIVASCNPATRRIFGYSPEEMIGRNINFLMPEPYHSQHDGYLSEYAHTGIRKIIGIGREVAGLRKDGTSFPLDLAVSEVRLNNARFFTGMVRDISERKAAEQRFHELNAELTRTVGKLAQTNGDLSQKNQENEMFVYSVSHDLRSPLVNLEGYSKELALSCGQVREIVESARLEADVRKRGLALIDDDVTTSIHYIQTAVMRLSNIIDALLQLSRAGRVEYDSAHVNLKPLLDGVLEAGNAEIVATGARVTLASLPIVAGDHNALERVFSNLIGNAIKYRDRSRVCEIEIGSAGAGESAVSPGDDWMATVYVKDNGLGIPKAFSDKVFRAFQRGHPRVAPGDGMGLAIVKRIVERLGGKVWFEPNRPFGTKFFISLPRVAAGASTEAVEQALSLAR